MGSHGGAEAVNGEAGASEGRGADAKIRRHVLERVAPVEGSGQGVGPGVGPGVGASAKKQGRGARRVGIGRVRLGGLTSAGM